MPCTRKNIYLANIAYGAALHLEAFHADITTVAHVDLHENRIYRAGCTLGVIRDKIKSVLQTITSKERLANFDPVNTSTEPTDPDNHSILTAFMSERTRVHANMTGCNEGKSMAGPSSAAAQQFFDREFERFEESYHDTNRTMYEIFADSKFIVHDINFHTYCKPHLQHLPTLCSVELQSIQTQLEAKEDPPYRPIQLGTVPEPTVPNYRRSAASSSLKPHPQWMKDTPPFMSDEDADTTYNEACAWMFGTSEPHPRNATRSKDITARYQRLRAQDVRDPSHCETAALGRDLDVAPDGSRLDPTATLNPISNARPRRSMLSTKRCSQCTWSSSHQISARHADARRELAPYDQATRDRTAKRATVEADNAREQFRQRLASAIQNSKSPATNHSDLEVL
jgi:hypothetical protein